MNIVNRNETVTANKANLEFCRCLVCSMAHITRADRELLWEISAVNLSGKRALDVGYPIDAARFDDGYMVKTYTPRGSECWQSSVNETIQELRTHGFSELFCNVFREACQHRNCYLLRFIQDTASKGCFQEAED